MKDETGGHETVSWKNCRDCGCRCKIVGPLCLDCRVFTIDIGPMDWNLFQRQRASLMQILQSDRISGIEADHLSGLLSLTDHIADTAKAQGRPVPGLNDLVLDQLAEL